MNYVCIVSSLSYDIDWKTFLSCRPWDSQHQGPIRPKKSTPLHLPTGGTSGYRTDFPDHNVVASGVALPKERKRIEIPWAPGALGTEYLAQYR